MPLKATNGPLMGFVFTKIPLKAINGPLVGFVFTKMPLKAINGSQILFCEPWLCNRALNMIVGIPNI